MLFVFERVVIAVVPQQQMLVCAAQPRRFHLSNKDRMIASVVHRDDATIYERDALVKNRRTGGFAMMIDVGKGIERNWDLFGKSLRENFLVVAQNIQRENFCVRDEFVRHTLFHHANENLDRFFGERGERVGGHAVNSVAIAHGEDGNAGGKVAHRVAVSIPVSWHMIVVSGWWVVIR